MFEHVFTEYFDKQIQSAGGRRLERLRKDLVGEKKLLKEVLWPVFHSFDGFTMEYEIKSIKGISIFIDAFYHPLRIAFESEGFVPHAEKITRNRFDFERVRIRTLAYYGYKFVPFTWDELQDHPEDCRRSVYVLLGRYTGADDKAIQELSVYEREVLRYMLRLNRPLRLEDAYYCLQKRQEASRKVLRKLVNKGMIRPLGTGQQKIHKYVLEKKAFDYML